MTGRIQKVVRSGKPVFPSAHPRALAVFVLVVALFFVAPLNLRADAIREIIRTGNAHLQIGFDARVGRLREFIDVKTGHNHVGNPAGALWEIQFVKSGGPATLSPEQARSFRVEPMAGDPQTLRLTWREFGQSQSPAMRVEVMVRTEQREPLSVWDLRVEGLGTLEPGSIRFPRVPGIAKQDRERLAVPVWQGQLAMDPRAIFNPPGGKAQRLEWSYPCNASPFIATPVPGFTLRATTRARAERTSRCSAARPTTSVARSFMWLNAPLR